VIQACGRVVRAPDDYGATYLADSSLLDLFDRTRGEMPGWFRDQVDRLSAPDLPDFETAAESATKSRSTRRSGGSGRGDRGSGRGGRGGAGSDDAAAGGRNPESNSNSKSESESNHPLSDVWGDG
jgi:hypothetical protein